VGIETQKQRKKEKKREKKEEKQLKPPQNGGTNRN